jgi:UDP-3-O-acyl-N-acetylglucosamine deacetylase
MRRIGYRPQRTLARTATVSGVGFITGADVRVRFRPAPPRTGLVLCRTDLPGAPEVAALAHHVTGANRRTTLGHPPFQITLVEHALAALAGLGIDNCRVEIDGPELPGLDGSAHGFVTALQEAGTVLQTARREIWAATEPQTLRDGPAALTLHPGPIAPQRVTVDLTPEAFAHELARCRTFLLTEEAEALRRQGIGQRVAPGDVLLFGPNGPVGTRQRYGNEPARHKALDLVGDLALFGQDLRGHVVAYRSGHALNVALARRLRDLTGVTHVQRLAA